MTSFIRRWRIAWRDTFLLFRVFGRPLAFFGATILGGGAVYFWLSAKVGEPMESLPAAIYLLLTLAFLQPSGEFPHHPILQIFYFFMPLIGLATLAQGLADFGLLLFNRRNRNKEWEMAVASTFNKHTILVGLGHLGFRVIKHLHELEEPVVVIDLNPRPELVAAVQELDVPVIQGDASLQSCLEAAGIRKARTIILCTQDDTLNLQIAVKARGLQPDIRVVIRIFDDEFAQSLQQQFGFLALSATGMAAPTFAAAAAGADITRPINIEGQALSLARLTVNPGARLIGMDIGQVEQTYDISVILLKRGGESDLHPAGSRKISPQDCLAVIGSPTRINTLVHDSQ